MKKNFLIIAMCLLLIPLWGWGQTTTKSNPGPPTIPASITYVGNEAEIAFDPDGALVYQINDLSPSLMVVDFGMYDVDQLNISKYVFQINSSRNLPATVIVKGNFTKNSTGISNNPSGVVGITNTGSALLKVSLEDFTMPNLGAGTEDFQLKIVESFGSTGPVEVFALNLIGRRYNAGVFDPTGDGTLNEFNIGTTNLGSGENTNIPINFVTTSLPIAWTKIWTEGSTVKSTGILTGDDVLRIEAQHLQNGNWRMVESYDPAGAFSHKAVEGGLYRFVAFYEGGKTNPTTAVNVKWSEVGYIPLIQLSGFGEAQFAQQILTFKGFPEGEYIVRAWTIEGKEAVNENINLKEGDIFEKQLNVHCTLLTVIVQQGGNIFTGKVVANNSDWWNPLKEK